jgi:hypothetical protein
MNNKVLIQTLNKEDYEKAINLLSENNPKKVTFRGIGASFINYKDYIFWLTAPEKVYDPLKYNHYQGSKLGIFISKTGDKETEYYEKLMKKLEIPFTHCSVEDILDKTQEHFKHKT